MGDNVKKVDRPPYGILSVLMIGAFITFLNNTLLNIALPSIMTDLAVGETTVQWLTTGFMLINGILIPITAFLIQKYSVRFLFLASMGCFAIGTILSGVAEVFSILLAGRMIQAAGTAVMMPLLMNVMLVSFPVEKRGAAMGMFGLIMMAAPAIGPTLSGWIVEHYDWRMLFHFITPIACATLIIGFFLLKDKKEKSNLRFDLKSFLLSSIGFGGIMYGFSSAGNNGWNHPLVFGTILIGVVTLTWFIMSQIKVADPMLNFKIFKYNMFALSATISMIVNMALFSGMLLLPIYVQTLRGITPMDAGLMMLPGALVMAGMSPITGRLFDKYGGRMLSVVGLGIMTITTYMFSKLTFDTGYVYLTILNTVRALGISMVMMPISTNGLNQLPKRFYPHGTAMNNTLNQVSGAIGTALLITIMSNRRDVVFADLTAAAARTNDAVTSTALVGIEQQIMLEATLSGINFSYFVAALLSAFALVLALFIKRATPADDPIEHPKAETKQQVVPKLVKNT